ncbi:MAG: restriction endonuclease [Candidatus Bathyarchaeia archaeon]
MEKDYEVVYLDMLDGAEFEKLCARIFHKLGIGRVEDVPYVGDEGRDILIHLKEGGLVVVECKHHPRGLIGRPIIQKLHSAVISSGASKGILVTTGRFTAEAIEYAKKVSKHTPIELVDIIRLRDIADRAGIKLIYGSDQTTIYTICTSETTVILSKIQRLVGDFLSSPLPAPSVLDISPFMLRLRPVYLIGYDIHADFVTSVGVIHSIHEENKAYLLDGENGNPLDEKTATFVLRSGLSNSGLIPKSSYRIVRGSFNLDITTLKKIVKDHIAKKYTTTVEYRGRNNVWYTKVCTPGERDINIRNVKLVLLPVWHFAITALRKKYNLTLIEDTKEMSIISTDLFTCRICNKAVSGGMLLCNECGNVTHRPKFLKRHGVVCKECGKTICINCAYFVRYLLIFRKYICGTCAKSLGNHAKRLKTKKHDKWSK